MTPTRLHSCETLRNPLARLKELQLKCFNQIFAELFSPDICCGVFPNYLFPDEQYCPFFCQRTIFYSHCVGFFGGSESGLRGKQTLVYWKKKSWNQITAFSCLHADTWYIMCLHDQLKHIMATHQPAACRS